MDILKPKLLVVFVVFFVSLFIVHVVKKNAYQSKSVVRSFLFHCGIYIILIVFFLFFLSLLNSGAYAGSSVALLSHSLSISVIIICGVFVYKLTLVLKDFIFFRYDVTAKDNLHARKVHTQFRMLQRIVFFVCAVVVVSGIFMTFSRLQDFGKGLFASAGIVGLLVGVSAQKTIGAFIAGIQLAATQPIRLDDVVIIEGEWGRIEEITLTYVVVKVWDLRRVVVPVSYFLEKPFQNWTRTSADVIGTVFIDVDYSVSVDDLRSKLIDICNDEASGLWDGKTCVLQVVESGKDNVTLRALVSASDASLCWDLRCLVREKLISYIQKEHPEAIPRKRLNIES